MYKGQIVRQSLIAILFLSLLVGCSDEDSGSSSDTVLAISDNTADFSTYQTFAVVAPSDDSENPPANLPEGDILALQNAIISALEALGLTQATEAEADLRVGAFIRVDTVESTATGFWYEYYWGWYWGYSETWYDEDIIEFDVGTLVIDAVDTRDKENADDDRLVFRGAALGLVGEESSDTSSRIEAAVDDIFDKWPEGSDD